MANLSENLHAPKTVLLVEDDACIRELMQYALEEEGYEVMTAANGRAGMEKLNRNPKPSLILLDMMMPVMSGREFLDVFLADTSMSNIPVVVVSASHDVKQAYGAKAFVKKPTELAALLKTVSDNIQH